MNSVPLQMFVTGSHTLEITAYRLVKDLGKGKCIQSERFTVGGYDWMIKYYPRGLHNSGNLVGCHQTAPGNDDYVSVVVSLLSTNKVTAMYSFSMFNWVFNTWMITSLNLPPVELVDFNPSIGYSSYAIEKFMKKSELDNNQIYMRNDVLKIKCTLCVQLSQPDSVPPPAPAPAPAPNGCGFYIDGYAPPNLPTQPTVRIYCEAAKHLSLTARKGVVVLAPADSSDRYQHWIKDMSYGDSVTDRFGYPAFALVNSVTGEALKTPTGENEEVSLVAYKPNSLEDFHAQPVKWSTDFIAIRIKDKEGFNMTALPSPKCENSFDGAKIFVKHWSNTPVQYWNIVPYNSNVPYKVICNH